MIPDRPNELIHYPLGRIKKLPQPEKGCIMVLTSKILFVFEYSRALRVCAAFFLFWLFVVNAAAELTPLEDTGLEEIWGTAGITIAVKNFQVFHHIDTIRYCASDNGAVELQNFLVHGIGNPAKFNFDFGTATSDSGIIYLDVFETEVAPLEDWSGDPITDPIVRGMTSAIVPNWDQELGYTAGSFILHDPTSTAGFTDPIDLGSITMGLIDMPRFATFTSPRIGGSGFDFQNNFQLTIDKIGYAYNSACDALELSSMYLGGNFVDAGDAPENPASWMPNRATPLDFGEFQIGDLFGDVDNDIYSNPAMIDVFEADIYNDGYIYGLLDLRLSMTGSIRFENVDFGGTDFGPGAIDGINVHRLELQLIP